MLFPKIQFYSLNLVWYCSLSHRFEIWHFHPDPTHSNIIKTFLVKNEMQRTLNLKGQFFVRIFFTPNHLLFFLQQQILRQCFRSFLLLSQVETWQSFQNISHTLASTWRISNGRTLSHKKNISQLICCRPCLVLDISKVEWY